MTAAPWVAVLAPLVLALAWLAWRAWRGTWPARPVLNAVSSVLLLVYVLVTAGLGLFWVAVQHLPVFDWHYLFGYAMLVLLGVHLAFNLRQLLLHLSRRPAAPAPRRPALRSLGSGLALAAFGGVAFWIGLRQGRTVLAGPAGGPGPDAAAEALAFVERFHAHSSHSRAGTLRRAASADWGVPPPPFKAAPAGRPRLDLPRQAVADAAFGLPQLGALLWHTAGVSQVRGGIHFRTAPSSGALFATELYVATRDRPGLPAGLWHHQAASDELVPLRTGDPGPVLLPPGADLAVWATAVFRRSGHKYGDRCYRYVLADLGHALENLRQASAVLGRPATLLAAFDEAAVARALGVDEAEEGVLACACIGAGPQGPSAPRQVWLGAPPSSASAPLGITDAVHRASSLRAPVVAAAASAAGPARPLPAAPGAGQGDPLRLIAARRSLRRYRPLPLPAVALAQVLRAMCEPGPLLSDVVQVHLLSPRVDTLEPAAWRLDRAGLNLVRTQAFGPAELPGRSRAAALDQEVIGDAAAVLVLTLQRSRLAADAAGPARAYRHAFIEAGLMGERLYLQAQALGLGACAVGAFYDDEAARLIGVDGAAEWPLHFAALGVPA